MQHIIIIQHLPGDSHCFGDEAHGADAAAFSIAPVVHLDGRLKNIFSGYGNRTDKTGDAAAALFFRVQGQRRHLAANFST